MENEEFVIAEGFLPDGTPVLPGARLTDEAIHCIAPVLAELFAAALARETNKKSTGLKYIVVPDKQMESFIKIASQYEENTIYYKPEEIDIRKGTHICIYGGKFNGVKGVFMRVKGKRRRRVVVMLEGIMGISVEVHPDLIEVINDSDCDKF